MPGVTRGIEWIRCSVVMWHVVIWVEMTCQLDTWHDADVTWMTGNGHSARIRGDDRWCLSVFLEGNYYVRRDLRRFCSISRDGRPPRYRDSTLVWRSRAAGALVAVLNIVFV
jgi:hypothetical protein